MTNMMRGTTTVPILHYHGFGGSGGGGKGMNRSNPRVGNLQADFQCIGGFDVDPGCCKDFERQVGVPLACIDLFSREQYKAFHGKEPPPGWREVTPDDIRKSAGYRIPNIVFLSAPCKGLSSLLSDENHKSPKYQALNQLTVHGFWMMLETWADDLPEFFIMENVPRIQTRGRKLLDQINALLRKSGYAVAETSHDCGEIGGLAQSRKRFLMVARNMKKVPPFLYEPPKRRLLGVGEILDKLPLPGDLVRGGPMHRVPSLQWRTWVRLAMVEAGSDWRSLNKLTVKDGMLADYGIVPAGRWEPGRSGIADPRANSSREGTGFLGVNAWDEHMGTVTGNGRPGAGAFSVADPRRQEGRAEYQQYGVKNWSDTGSTVIGKAAVGSGAYSVADPRAWEKTPKFNNCFRVVRYDQSSPTVTGGGGPSAGGPCVADPRWNTTDNTHPAICRVFEWSGTTGVVTGASRVSGGAMSVADPRPDAMRGKRQDFDNGGHYGVVGWDETAGVVTSSGKHDNGKFSVADPRDAGSEEVPALPGLKDSGVFVIQAIDGTWHRPFTTLELAALQSLVDPDEILVMEGKSDAVWREHIGNMVPPAAAEAIGNVMGQTILMARTGVTFQLSSEPIWVQPMLIALSVDPSGQPNWGE